MRHAEVIDKGEYVEIVDEQLLPISSATYVYRQTYSVSKAKFRSPAMFDYETAKWPKEHGVWSDHFKSKQHELILDDIMQYCAPNKDDSNLMPAYVFHRYVVRKHGYGRYYLVISKNPAVKLADRQKQINHAITSVQAVLSRSVDDILTAAAFLKETV